MHPSRSYVYTYTRHSNVKLIFKAHIEYIFAACYSKWKFKIETNVELTLWKKILTMKANIEHFPSWKISKEMNTDFRKLLTAGYCRRGRNHIYMYVCYI